MVNYGRPSRDCFPCRRRKLRCDLRTEGCSQCSRAKLTCYGYRDPNELAFRDETYATTQRALTRQASVLPVPATPHLTWEDQSRNTFLSLYVAKLSRNFDDLAYLLGRSAAAGHLHASVSAASLAFMAFQLSDSRLIPLANQRYVGAIQSLRLALCNSQLSISDEILQSVLLLDLCEKITNRATQQQDAWMRHAQGAFNIAISRASTGFSSPITCHLANRTATAVIISCGTAGIPVPDALGPLRKGLGYYGRDVKWNFTSLLVNIVNLRAEMRGAVPGSTGASNRLRRAMELDKQLKGLANSMSQFWNPQCVLTTTDDPLVFGRHYDLYQSHYATQVSNAVRMMRLEMCSMICNLNPEEQSGSGTSAAKTISEMTRQICATVPQFLLLGARAENTIPLSPLQVLRCCTLLPSLYLSAQLTRESLLRDWILRCIVHMSENGVKVAQDVFQILRSTPDLDYWSIYAMVGSYAVAA